MAGFFSSTIAHLAKGGVINVYILCEMDFVEGVERYWLNGPGKVRVAGQIWQGVSELVSIGSISAGSGDAADELRFMMSGVTPRFVALARNAESIRGRRVTIYGQFFDKSNPATLLDARWIIPTADVMDRVEYSEMDVTSITVALVAETIWTARDKNAGENWSRANQRELYPDDTGMDFLSKLQNAVASWPIYD